MKTRIGITISVGDELLSGNTIDSNNAFISRSLESAGVKVKRKIIVGDDETEIREALDQAFQNADIITLTGGLGPTHDDITKQTLQAYFGVGETFHADILEELKQRFAARGIKMAAINRNQACYPENARLLENPVGTARGMHFTRDDRQLFVMPGVPREMQAIMETGVLPFLEAMGLPSRQVLDIHTTGIPESTLFERARDLLIDEKGLKVAFLPKHTGVTIRVSLPEQSAQAAKALQSLYLKLTERFSKHVYGCDADRLETVVGQLLSRLGKTVATAESCTGGQIASTITDIGGSSVYFSTGFVTYANESKVSLLGVQTETLESHGAVSEETVSEMLSGVLARTDADYALAVSGIAGPGGGTADKPVGTVYIGVADRRKQTIRRFNFSKIRKINKDLTTSTALNMLRLRLQNDALD